AGCRRRRTPPLVAHDVGRADRHLLGGRRTRRRRDQPGVARVLPATRHRNRGLLGVPGFVCGRGDPDLGEVRPPAGRTGHAGRLQAWSRTPSCVSTQVNPRVTDTPGRAMRQQLLGNTTEIRRAYTGHMGQPETAPLTGYRIAVTSA